MKQIALLSPRMPAFDDDATGDDPIEEALEFFGAVADASRDLYRRVLRAIDARRADFDKQYADARIAETDAKNQLAVIAAEIDPGHTRSIGLMSCSP
jgi:hypothetical protein